MTNNDLKNPFRPGAGHMPPFLAGRNSEKNEFSKLLQQETILENLVLTGLRGVGKTVLLEVFKPIALKEGWLWAGTDLSESATLNEGNIALRFLTDLSLLTSSVVIGREQKQNIGFLSSPDAEEITLDFKTLSSIYDNTPGLPADKLKNVLEYAWQILKTIPNFKGIIFAYDEAQNFSDHAEKDQFPLSLILDVFQSIQRKGVTFMLALTGLPTLFPKLVESRTFSERMFRVIFIDKLQKSDVKEAIIKPLKDHKIMLSEHSIETIIELSGGYPYFVQFICREIYDLFIQQIQTGVEPSVPSTSIIQKLDSDFFSGRWSKATDRQRELLAVIANIETCDDEFSVQEIVIMSKRFLKKPFGNSHVNQMLLTLSSNGLVYKNRHGKYSFAVPLLGRFIKRQDIQGTIEEH